ncbi:MAG: 5-oxoprolinase subunit B family protein, partial [Polyangiaceae bacterium]
VTEPFGDAALRITLPPGTPPGLALAGLRAVPGIVDAVVAEGFAVVTFEPGRPPPATGALEALAGALHEAPASRTHSVRVVYDGADLDLVASRAGLTVAQVVELHASAVYEVAAVGFLPGFAYLGGLDPRLVGPRRSEPRARVPAGSVAVAGPYTGVYPFASPGGWNVIGRAVGFVPFSTASGAALAVGDRVRFVAAAGE